MTVKISFRTVLVSAGVIAVAFLVLGTVGIASWEYTNSNAFCGGACHGVHPDEPVAHQLGRHANVACVECHIGRMSTFASMIEKSGHVVHAWNFVFGYERPTRSTSLTEATQSCEGCHTKAPHQNNIVNTSKKFDTDRRNTETRMTLTMRLAGRTFGGEVHRGVNWHASGAVRFIADDPQRLDIRWVEATAPNGTKTIYENVTKRLTGEQIEQADKHVMDCIDCHNRAGHPFSNPLDEVDAVLADGRLSPALPFIKRQIVELLEGDYDSHEEAVQLLTDAWAEYAEKYADIAQDDPEAWQAVREFFDAEQGLLYEMMVRSRFVGEEGVSWRSFPDHNGHKTDPGCFRCHSGGLQTQAGVPITPNCTNCHSVPLVTKRDRVPNYFLTLIDKQKPDSHHDKAFISKHMDLAGDECTACHEQLRFGVNDRSYCSNSGCHGNTWEFLQLDALRTAAEAIVTPEPD